VNRLEVDVTQWLIAHVASDARLVGKTPDKLETVVPLIRFVRVGGSDDGVTLDRATVVAHCFATDLATATMLALKLGTAYRALRGQALDGAVITRVETLNGPTWTPYGNPLVEQVVRTDRISIKGT
jgi:hypothetical protein